MTKRHQRTKAEIDELSEEFERLTSNLLDPLIEFNTKTLISFLGEHKERWEGVAAFLMLVDSSRDGILQSVFPNLADKDVDLDSIPAQVLVAFEGIMSSYFVELLRQLLDNPIMASAGFTIHDEISKVSEQVMRQAREA